MRGHAVLSILALMVWLSSAAASAASYAFRSDTHAWESASQPVVWEQTHTRYPRDDDQMVVHFTGGFRFNFGGVAYSAVRIHANGALQFGADSGFHRLFSNTALPVSGHDRLILVYWDDINPNTGGTVRYEQKGSAPHRHFVVSWENVPHFSLAGTYTFQVILFENGDFKFQYGSGNAAGASATIGVEVDDADFTLFSHNHAWGTSGTAIRWTRARATPGLAAFYAFEDPPWSGAAQEVHDRSGQERHGNRVGNAQVIGTGRVCQGASIPANSTAALVNAVNTGFDLDATLGSQGSLTFWYRGNANWSASGAHDAQLADATTVNNRWFFLTKDNNGRIRLVLTDSGATTVHAETANNAFPAGTWVHIAATWALNPGHNQSVLRIYLNGTLAASRNVTTTGNLHADINSLYLGDNRSAVIKTGGSDKGTAHSANGTLDQVRLYSHEISSAQVSADMNATHGCALNVILGGFNVVDPGGDAVTGTLSTRTAGTAFTLELVALNVARSAQAGSFSGSVQVDLIANLVTGVSLDGNNCPVTGTVIPAGTAQLATGRGAHAFPALADAWRDVRVRVRHPASGGVTTTACSADNFAIKPATLAAVASHSDWERAGTGRILNASAAHASPIHKAGAPFTLTLTARNAAGQITSQYHGSPTAQVSCILPAHGCVPGTLSTGTFSAAGGIVTSSSASYSEVGAISVVFADSTFAAVDAADTPASCAGYHVCSPALTVGRFVPDRFEMAANTPSFVPACGGFSYLGQPFGLGVAPRLTVTAVNRAGATTVNYAGDLWKITAATVTGQSWSAAAGSPEAVGSLPPPLVTGVGAGMGQIEFAVGSPAGGGGLRFRRTTLTAPFHASLDLTATIRDSDGVAYPGNPFTLSSIGFDDGNPATRADAEMRFGRLRLLNAHGSERLALPMPLVAQYWNGQGFVTNALDHCTDLAPPGLTFYPQTPANRLASGETGASHSRPLVAGQGNLRLTAPGLGNHGFVDLLFAPPPWLRYDWDGIDQGNDGDRLDDAPRARASFGVRNSGSRVIIRRELY